MADSDGWLRQMASRKDFYAGGLMIVLGLGMALKAPSYGMGTLFRMGPGFFPTALGILMAFIGLLIALTALSDEELEAPEKPFMPAEPPWRGWLCLLTGPILFIVLGIYAGLIPASFVCTFVSALGDRESTLKSALAVATVITVVAVVLFHWLLGVHMPLLGAL